jgi:EAL domain-containing protein (putative c-di-GMP-specific phosphodiesterase class I)
MLRELRCDHAQGFFMGRPMAAGDFALWSNHWLGQQPTAITSQLAVLH